jgi:7-carboxy-7-deazaguanine synthase
MTYTVHALFLTLQGEGANLGRVAVFCRFAGCNLWSGREQDRADAACRFCDTEFRGGARYVSAAALAGAAASLWPGDGPRLVVLTGGEPALQADAPLVEALRAHGFVVAMETNGTVPLRARPDWVCVSPKAGARVVLAEADELKLVYPQAGAEPERFTSFAAAHRWLSPMDGPDLARNVAAAAAYCRRHPAWRLNIQAHKAWGIP